MIGLVTRSLAVAIGACMLVFLLAVFVGARLPISGRNGTIEVLAAVLALLAVADWLPVVLVARLVRQAPDVEALRDQLSRLLFEALTATLLGVLGLNYLLGSPLPHGAGYFVFVLAALLVSTPSMHWLIKTYRGA